ncbi:MAG TPA: hypothetical protein VHA78_02770 [Candidatus Peribacteraceae bacterium]|nr:hypothetical protein [Candidatus Peribacteraceae bacterium]
MDQLPSSIEAYLEEAGFSGTEILILKKLLEEDALTIRELAAKTGKSTGSLDQAMKKLLKKEIVTREIINDTPKYLLHSLSAVSDWMKRDMEQKQRMIVRKYENFEAFLASLKKNKQRPEMEYFEGLDGLKRAYMRLLDCGKVMLSYGPQPWSEDEDPLHDFKAEFARERKKRGVLSRVITHDTPVGRKMQSRDPFEHQETLLVDRMKHPFTFERIIIGDTVACFQLEEQRACFIYYPELAEEERVFFERLWHEKMTERHMAHNQQHHNEPSPTIIDATLSKTKVWTDLRQFFFSRRSLVVTGLLALLSGAITYALYDVESSLNLKRIQDEVKSIAATGALQFNAKNINQIHILSDVHTPAYVQSVQKLKLIRSQNKDVKYAYIMRPTGVKDIFEFVADADSLDPYAKKDLNGDGIVDDADATSYPGEAYDTQGDGTFQIAMTGIPSADPHSYTDQWGTFISGGAPIRDSSGTVIAVLGIDIYANKVGSLTSQTFFLSPVLWFFILFIIFIAIRLFAFDAPLIKEILLVLNMRKVVFAVSISLGISLLLSAGLYVYTQHLNFQRMQKEVEAVAEAAAPQFNPADLNALQVEADWQKPQWAKVVNQLAQVKKNNPDLVYVYLIRKVKNDPSKMEFVSDAGSLNPFANTDNDPTNDVDANGDGVIDASGADLLQWPGQPYPDPPKETFIAYNNPTYSDFYQDSWGKVVSGYAPIKNQNGNTIAVVAADMKAGELSEIDKESVQLIIIFVLCLSMILIFLLNRKWFFHG